MTRQKRFFAALLALMMALALAACNSSDPAPEPTEEDPATDPAAETITVKLVGDFSNGAPNALELGLYQYQDVELAAPVTVEAIAEELTNWTGLDFFINSATVNGDEVIVDWAANATLIAGLDEREQKEEFFFFDVVSLNFFMMDTLASTIKENMGATLVYYSMDGGQPLSTSAMEDMGSQGFFELPLDIAYEGSAFFAAHNDVKGD